MIHLNKYFQQQQQHQQHTGILNNVEDSQAGYSW